MPPRGISLAEFLRRKARFGRAGTVKMELYLVLFPGNLNRISPSTLVPTFRGSHPVAAPSFCEPRKANGHQQSYDSSAVFRIEVLDEFSTCCVGLQFDGPSRFRAALTAASAVMPKDRKSVV